jgi:hypothetical protein
MATRAGTGFSDEIDSALAGHMAAMEATGGRAITGAPLVFLFISARHDAVQVHTAVRAIVGPDAVIAGGSGGGVITGERLGMTGYEVGVAMIESDDLRAEVFLQEGVDNDPFQAGVALARQMEATGDDPDRSLLFFFDSVKVPAGAGPPQLNMATPFVDGLAGAMSPWPSVAGAGLLADDFRTTTVQIANDRIAQQSAIGLVLSGGLRMDTHILHGCQPASRYRTITGTDGNCVLEIDNVPALDLVESLMGPGSVTSIDDFPLLVTLGVNRGDRYGEYREEDYANRLCVAVDHERRGLVMFEPDLSKGDEVQLMRRSINLDYIGQRISDALRRNDGARPVFALYIDCLGRAARYCGSDQEEAAEVQRQLGPDIPLLGFYSGVEIGRVGDTVQALDWTGVLCLFTEREPA